MAPRKAEQVAILRKEVEQLQHELGIERQPLSVTIQDLIKYTQDNVKDEYLLRKDAKLKSQIEDKVNPFVPPKTGCLPCSLCSLM
eukprot:GFUD01081141.1.p1 GENE.GFUD01081141.1~~GFUD01081141.1.p1  ORF type:complete len:100 (+),score=24.43 GFUD01081141.1:46-300(+)